MSTVVNAKFKHMRGTEGSMPTLLDGQLYLCTDNDKVYKGTAGGNKLIGDINAMNDVLQEFGTLETNYNGHVGTDASETVKGHIQMATDVETSAGTIANKAVNPKGLKTILDARMNGFSGANSKNLLVNGNFERFATSSSAGENWTIVAGDVTNTFGSDVTTFYSGGKSQYLNKSASMVATTMNLSQSITNPDLINLLKGKKITLKTLIKTTNAGLYGLIQCRDSNNLAIGGNISTNLHSGDGTWQTLSADTIVPQGTVSIYVYACYYNANLGSGVVYIDNAQLQISELSTQETEFLKSTTELVTTLAVKTTTLDADKKVIYSTSLKGLLPSDVVMLYAQFEITNPQAYNIGVGKYLVRATDATTITGTSIAPAVPTMENIPVDIHHKVFQLIGFDTTHGGGNVTYNAVAYATASGAGVGHTCNVETGYGGLYAVVL